MRALALIVISILALLNSGAGECAAFYHAFEWSCDGSYTDLGTLPGGTDSWANANNQFGQVAGWSTNPAGERHAVRWEADGSIVDLGAGVARDIDDQGQVVGDSNGRAVIWDADGAMHDITAGVAEALNNKSQVVGSLVTTGESGTHVFVWSALVPTSVS